MSLQEAPWPEAYRCAYNDKLDAMKEALRKNPATVRFAEKPHVLAWTCLHQSAYHGNAEMARFLLEHGADPSARGEWGGNWLTAEEMARAGGKHHCADEIERYVTMQKLVLPPAPGGYSVSASTQPALSAVSPFAEVAVGSDAPASTAQVQQHTRMADVAAEDTMANLGPITGVSKAERLTLLEAAEKTGVDDVDAHAYLAAENGERLAASDPHGLSGDEAGALILYTMESELYPTLNTLLRDRDRKKLKPFFPYLRILLEARQKLPPYVGSVWRGVAGVDLRDKYPKGREFYWWAFSSTTKQISTLLNPQFLGRSGVRTVFMIEALTGIDIERYSAFQGDATEAEVLLFPGSKFVVVDAMDMGDDLFQVHLRQVVTPVALLK